MKLIKVLSLVIACVILLSTSLMPVSAVEISYDDWIDIGFVDDGTGNLYHTEASQLPFFFASFNTSPRYPDFNPNMLPWLDFPKYIQDIVYSDLSDFNNLTLKPPSDFRIPFVMLTYDGQNCDVWVGYNLALGYVLDNDYIRIFGNGASTSLAYPFTNNVCYFASYSISSSGAASLMTDWYQRSGSNFWSGKLVYYSKNYSESTNDFYLYGGNAIGLINDSSAGKLILPTSLTVTDNNHSVSFNQDLIGFGSGRFFPSNLQYDSYWTTFTPPTAEVLEQETSKSILDVLRGIPDKIGDFFENLKNYLLYFQADKPEHVNPFAGILDDVQSFFDDQIGDTTEFKNSLNSTFENVSTYISTGSSVINKLLDGVPLLNAFLIFFLVISVIRKVVGR